MVCRPAADSYRCRPAIMHDLCDRTALLLKEHRCTKDRFRNDPMPYGFSRAWVVDRACERNGVLT